MYLSLKLNLSLLNVLREFKTDPSAFSTSFLKETRQHLNNSDSLIAKDSKAWVKEHLEFGTDFIIMAIHIAFAKVANLGDFIKIMKSDHKLASLNVSAINKTNLFNRISLTNALQAINAESADSVYLDKFSISIITDDSEKIPKCSPETLYIPISLLTITTNTISLLDISFHCYICDWLNNSFSGKSLKLHPWILPNADLVKDFSDLGLVNLNTFKNLTFTHADVENYMKIIYEHPKDLDTFKELFPELETLLFYSVNFQNTEIESNLERLLIAMLGHWQIEVRNRATLFLNILYDKTHWQFRGALKTKISTVGEPFQIHCIVESESDASCFAILLNAFSFEEDQKLALLSWHLPKVSSYESENVNGLIISMDFGAFPRTGFYDWKLVKLQPGGKIASVYTGYKNAGSMSASLHKIDNSNNEDKSHYDTKPIQGRFIVHPKDTYDLQLHEILADSPQGLPTETHRGNFQRIADSIPEYARLGINALYVMGAFERDCNLVYGDNGKIITNSSSKRKDSSPLAITNRTMPNKPLGGQEGLKATIQVAKKKGVKIILDFVTRVSSGRHHKRYKPYLLHVVDSQGKKTPFFGSDGRGWYYEDTTILNFR